MWNFVKNIFKGIGVFLKRFARTTAAQIMEDIGDIAVTTVQRVENHYPDATGKEKFEAAYNSLATILMQRGIKYTKNALNIAIEAAVAVVKEGK